MPTYKLIYFNARGRAEPIRLVLAQSGVSYEDKRIEFKDWPELKPNTPFGVLPVLEIDGKRLGGTIVIARYLGEEFGLAGSNAFENAEIAAIADWIDEYFGEWAKTIFEKDETKKAELLDKFGKEVISKYFDILEKKVSPEGWLYGNKVTWVDLFFYTMITKLPTENKNALDKYPGLNKVKKNVESLPNIAKWIKERPETQH